MRIARLAALVMLGIVLAWLAGAAWMRVRGPDAAQARAIALLEMPVPPVAGRDASDAVRLLGHDVPAAEHAAAAAAARAREAREAQLRQAGKSAEADALPDPLAKYPAFAPLANDAVACELNKEHECLALVRSDPGAIDAVLQEHARAIDAALALADYDGFRLGVAPSLYAPLPNFGSHRRLVVTRFARQFDRGDVAAALNGVCRDLAGWRRLGADSDHLIPNMVGAAYVAQDLRLLAALLAEAPADTVVPDACTAALAPTTAADLDACPAIRGEFAMLRGLARDGLVPPDAAVFDRVAAAAIDRDRVDAHLAQHFAVLCEPAARDAARADRALPSPPPGHGACTRWERMFDPASCLFVELALGSDLGRYANRRVDLGAQLALMRTVLWLRATDGDPRPRAQRLRERPAGLDLRREPVLAADARSLRIPLLDARQAPEFELALPAPLPTPTAD